MDLERARSLVAAAGGRRVTFAGGLATAAEIAALDWLGADVQVGTALATGSLGLAEAFAAPLQSDRPDGLWPTLACDEGGRALGLAWSDLESLEEAFATGRGVYRSRNRGLWRKGEGSGAIQRLIRAELDCERDAIRFLVRQEGSGFCHSGSRGCFGEGSGIELLARRVAERLAEAPEGSYTRRLLEDPALLSSKLREEADELGRARGPREAAAEAADLIYFGIVKAVGEGASLADIEAELDRRSLRVTRRGGAPKQGYGISTEALVWNAPH
jgi:phosphoribosyl-ATP pyrophosphohydrolase